MSQLQTFENNLFELAVMSENGEISFDVETVAKSLGFTQMKMVMNSLDGRELMITWENIPHEWGKEILCPRQWFTN